MYLHDDLASGHCVMVHVRIEKCKATRRKGAHLSWVKDVSHPNLKGPRDDRDVLPLWMPVRCDPVSVRHFQTYGVVPGRGGRVALDHSKLRTLGDKWRRWPPRDCLWRECVLVVRTGLCGNRDQLACEAQHSKDRQGD